MPLTRQSSSALEGDTLRYYARNARDYAGATFEIDMSAVYDRFLKYIEKGGLILDAGSGSGRDTLGFMNRRYRVEAFDASPELCALSTNLTGIRTSCLRFQDFNRAPDYDGIWACASLLHVPARELCDVLKRLAHALKPGGAFYMSFKYGSGERIADDGRLYVDMDERALRRLLEAIPEVTIEEIWRSGGEGTHQGKDAWLNAIALKSGQGQR